MKRLLTVLPLLVGLSLAAGCTNGPPASQSTAIPSAKGKATQTGNRTALPPR